MLARKVGWSDIMSERLLLMNNIYLVSGGAGFIGSHLVEDLLANGCLSACSITSVVALNLNRIASCSRQA